MPGQRMFVERTFSNMLFGTNKRLIVVIVGKRWRGKTTLLRKLVDGRTPVNLKGQCTCGYCTWSNVPAKFLSNIDASETIIMDGQCQHYRTPCSEYDLLTCPSSVYLAVQCIKGLSWHFVNLVDFVIDLDTKKITDQRDHEHPKTTPFDFPDNECKL